MNSRTGYLDGLRGFAALQVILLHYFTAFIPILSFPQPYQGWRGFTQIMSGTFLYYFYDGNSAIDLFFLLSGYVLTLSYLNKKSAFWNLAIARTIRLGIPVSASLCIAWILFSFFPNQHQVAGRLSGSTWLSDLGNVVGNSWAHIKEICLGSLIIGYSDSSFWHFFMPVFNLIHPPLSPFSLNFPLWTLNLEFYGSLMILILSLLLKESKKVYLVWLVLMVGFFQPFSISLFFIGQLFALAERCMPFDLTGAFGKPLSIWGTVVAWCLIALAIIMSSRGLSNPGFLRIFSKVPMSLLQKEVGSILIFGSVLFFKHAGTPGRPLIALLESPFFQFLGKQSFSVYLMHVPILFTISSGAYVFLRQFETQNTATVLTIFWGIVFTYLISTVFEKYVDGYALAISRARSAKP